MKNFYISIEADFVLRQLERHNFEGYIVGGSVRDNLMGLKPSDFDVTTSATPEEIEEIFKNYKLITLGKKYGTIGILINGEIIETTTYRSDGEYKDGRHPEKVSFSRNLEEDLKRRDFTVNAMAMDRNKNLIDIFGGQEDLKNKIIRTVGNPIERFEEDKLRMLRAVRFANRLDFEIERETFQSIKEYAPKIEEVSKERIREELDKILLSDRASEGIILLLETGLLEVLIPELMPTVGYDQMSPYHHKNLFYHILCTVDNVPKKVHLRLAALLHDIGKVETLSIDEDGVGHFYGHDKLGAEMARKILKRLKYDNKTIKSVEILIDRHMKNPQGMGEKGLKRLINRVGEDLIFDLLDLNIADLKCTREDRDASFLYERKKLAKELIERKAPYNKNALKIDGNDLIEIGFKEGKIIGEVLDKLTDMVIDDESLNEKNKLLEIGKELLKENE